MKTEKSADAMTIYGTEIVATILTILKKISIADEPSVTKTDAANARISTLSLTLISKSDDKNNPQLFFRITVDLFALRCPY